MRSRLFHSSEYRAVQTRVCELINGSPDFLSDNTAHSPRAVGDALADIVARSFDRMLGPLCAEYSSEFARRAMADIAFKDADGLYYIVDVKTHRQDTKFNMPNLTSVERLARFYEDDRNFFTILMIDYGIKGNRVLVSGVHFVPIEFLAWGCLTVGALGWGQIQIADSNRVEVRDGYSRKRWMLEFCDVMLEFYPKEIAKIGERVERFREVRDYWNQKADS